MKLKLYQVDAFARQVFAGNPAAVVPLTQWLGDDLMQNIAQENNLSETVFFVQKEQGIVIRWFTPVEEVALCGHATLAAAHVLYQHLGYQQDVIEFHSQSGVLLVSKTADGYAMDFPASLPKDITVPPLLIAGLNGAKYSKIMAAFDYVIELPNEQALKQLTPDFAKWLDVDLRGVVVTAKASDSEVDFVSRCFFPKLSINEDPITGSAHCELAPYWQAQLNKNDLNARQLSKRGGAVSCKVNDDRVILTGCAVDYLVGDIWV